MEYSKIDDSALSAWSSVPATVRNGRLMSGRTLMAFTVNLPASVASPSMISRSMREAGKVGGEPQYATCILREVAGDSGGVDAAGLADRQPAMIHHVGLVDLRIRQHAARLVDDGDYGVAAGAGKPSAWLWPSTVARSPPSRCR